MKRLSIVAVLLLATNFLLANEDGKAPVGDAGLMEWALYNIVFIIAAAVILGAFLAILNLFNKLIEVQKIRILREQGVEVDAIAELQKKPNWWAEFYKKLTKAVPIEKEKDVMLDHDYDGIKELDNVLPPWWVATFYVTIIAGVFYFGYWHFSDYGYSSAEEYAMNMEQAEKEVKAYLASQADMVDETNVAFLEDETAIMMGSSIFNSKCISCHGQYGEGNSIGPNLTDEYWLHGGGIKDVFKTVKYGVPEKGMISWKAQLRPAEIQKVASYILSLQGTNPPNAKAPQGEKYVAEEMDGKIGMR